jgi:hypothetical protein
METVLVGLARLARLLQKWGPYFMIELVMPGGTLLALLLFLYQRRNGKLGPGEAEGPTAMMRALFGTVQQSVLVLQPSYSRSAQGFRKGASR